MFQRRLLFTRSRHVATPDGGYLHKEVVTDAPDGDIALRRIREVYAEHALEQLAVGEGFSNHLSRPIFGEEHGLLRWCWLVCCGGGQ